MLICAREVNGYTYKALSAELHTLMNISFYAPAPPNTPTIHTLSWMSFVTL